MNTHESTVRIEDLLAHRTWLRGLARALVHDEHRAADLEQETWRTAVERPPARRGSGRGWLATVLRNRARDDHRRATRRHHREARAAKPERERSTEELASQAETQRAVIDAVLALEEPYRSTVLLRHFDDLSTNEVGKRMAVPASTVRTRLARAHEQLRARLAAHFGDEERSRRALIAIAWPAGAATVAGGGLVLAFLAAAIVVVGVVFAWRPWMTHDVGEDTQPVELSGTRAPAAGDGDAREPMLHGRAPKDEPVVVAPPGAAGMIEKMAGPVQHVDVRVVDAWDRPVRDATVRLVSAANDKGQPPGTVLAKAVTDAEGAAKLSPFPPTAIARVWAHDEDHAGVTKSFKGFDLSKDPVRVVLARARTLRGRLVDPFAEGVAEARMILHAKFPPSIEAIAWSVTDESGWFEIPHVPHTMLGAERSVEAQLEARAKGFTESWLDLAKIEGVSTLTMVIEVQRIIRGRLVNEDGKPVADAAIELPDSVGGQSTGADGRFVIKRLPPRAVLVRFASKAYVVEQVKVPFDGSHDTDLGDVVLKPGLTLEGNVFDADGKRVTDAWVAVSSNRVDQIVRQGPVKKDGTFRFEHLDDGEHEIYVFTDDGAEAQVKGVRAGGEPVDVRFERKER